MNEMTVLLSESQQKALQLEIHRLITNEINQFCLDFSLNEKYLKKKHLCHYLNLSNNTVDKLIASGMPYVNVQGVVLYDKAEIDQWLKKHIRSA